MYIFDTKYRTGNIVLIGGFFNVGEYILQFSCRYEGVN